VFFTHSPASTIPSRSTSVLGWSRPRMWPSSWAAASLRRASFTVGSVENQDATVQYSESMSRCPPHALLLPVA
jgi:hypothetical protein